jgi:hypothetical protein
MSKQSLIEAVRIENPCEKDWNEMRGGEKVRVCDHCALEVNNVSALSRREALRLVRRTSGRICLRYEKDPRTGEPIFAGKLYQITKRAGLAAGVLGASLSFSAMTYAQSESPTAPTVQTVSAATADDGAASLSGFVTDPNGAVVAFAMVTLFNEQIGFYQSVNTSAEGFYEFKNLPSALYKLRIEGAGFETKEFPAVDLSGGDSRQDARLALPAVQEVVEVGGGNAEDYGGALSGVVVVMEARNPLVQAVFNGDLEEVKVRVAMRARVNARDKAYDGITALHAAVELGRVEIAQFLLAHGAKANGRDFQRRTPLMMLDEDATPEMVQTLLAHGAKINLFDKTRSTALHHFAEYDRPEILSLLIAAGADVNAVNKEGKTPLMYAAENNSAESVRSLLAAGANPNAAGKNGETAWELGDAEVRSLLESYGAVAKSGAP